MRSFPVATHWQCQLWWIKRLSSMCSLSPLEVTIQRMESYVGMLSKKMLLLWWTLFVTGSMRQCRRRGTSGWSVCFILSFNSVYRYWMEQEVAVSNNNESEVDISSLDCSFSHLWWFLDLVNKTWRVYAISPILSTVNEQSFINSLVPSLRQEYEKYSGPLNNVKLLRVLVHEIEAIQGFDYCVGYNLSFTDKDRAISLYCCIFAQYPRSTHVSHSMFLVVFKSPIYDRSKERRSWGRFF